jgi:hypothetical protein
VSTAKTPAVTTTAAAATAASTAQTKTGTTTTQSTTSPSSPTSSGNGTTSTAPTTAITTTPPSTNQPSTCSLNATTANFAAQIAAATTGQTICLANGNYGNWSGTNKAITIIAASGAVPTMAFTFGSGDTGFTLDGMSGMSGVISGGATNITTRNSAFSDETDVLTGQMNNANIVFDHDHFPGFVGTARLWTQDYNSGGASGVIVQNSLFDNPNNLTGIADGVRCDGSSIQILNNEFSGINDASSGNHGDPIQIYGGTHCVIKGNYFHNMINSATCSLDMYDGGDHNTFENNVVRSGGCYEAVAISADNGSLVDHNTFITSTNCFANPQSECASVATGAKSGSSGSGTIYRNNVMASINNGNSGTNASYSESYNLFPSSSGGTGDIIGVPILSGGSIPTTWAGFKLTSNSPGYHAASDGLSMGIN